MTGPPYIDALSEAYNLARAEHLAHLHFEAYPGWEPGGVHAFSRAIGEFEQARAEWMVENPTLWAHAREELFVDRFLIRDTAREDAVKEYEEERFADWAMRMRVERKELV